MSLSHREMVIIELFILLLMVGGILVWMLFKGYALDTLSFITTR